MKSLLLLSFFIYSLQGLAEFKVPAIKNHVNDYASIIDSAYENKINALLSTVKKQTGIEMAVLTMDSLEGESIEQASIQITDKWQLGTKKEDLGLLLLIAVKDRQMRLEVGQGLEGQIPDAYAKRIIDDNMIPLFKAGHMNEGVLLGVYQTIKLAAPDFPVDQYINGAESFQQTPRKKLNNWWVLLIWIFIIFVFPRSPFLTGLLLGRATSYRGRGGFGGGGFGGGSFGGGGGFSGGGASGRW